MMLEKQRPKTPNYASPVILNADGREQLVFSGCNLVASFEPLTGKSLWEIEGATTECVTSVVTDGRLISAEARQKPPRTTGDRVHLSAACRPVHTGGRDRPAR